MFRFVVGGRTKGRSDAQQRPFTTIPKISRNTGQRESRPDTDRRELPTKFISETETPETPKTVERGSNAPRNEQDPFSPVSWLSVPPCPLWYFERFPVTQMRHRRVAFSQFVSPLFESRFSLSAEINARKKKAQEKAGARRTVDDAWDR